MYRMFLDDERYPVRGDWVIVRSYDEAVAKVLEAGFPVYVSFDNDLGGEKEGRDFARWLIEHDLDTGAMPSDFDFYVHSQNPVAADAIRALLGRYLTMKGIPDDHRKD